MHRFGKNVTKVVKQFQCSAISLAEKKSKVPVVLLLADDNEQLSREKSVAAMFAQCALLSRFLNMLTHSEQQWMFYEDCSLGGSGF